MKNKVTGVVDITANCKRENSAKLCHKMASFIRTEIGKRRRMNSYYNGT